MHEYDHQFELFLHMGKVRIITIAVVAAFVAMVVVQVILMSKAVEANRQTFANRVNTLLHEVSDRFKKTDQSSQLPHLNMDKLDKANLALLEHELNATLREVLKENDMDLPYQLGIYLHQQEKKVLTYAFGAFRDRIDLGQCMNSYDARYKFAQFSLNGSSHTREFDYHIVIHFPNLSRYLISQITGLIIICILFAIILIYTFIYFLHTIYKQKKAADIKNDFINNLTHEFKTPLFSIGLASSFLKRDPYLKSSTELSRHLLLIDNENNRMKNHVDKILQMALIDSDNFSLEKSTVDLHQLIHETIIGFELSIASKSANIALELNAAHFFIEGDGIHLKNMLYNLIDNSLKYSNENPIIKIETKNINVMERNKTQGILAILVQDNGIGMSEEVQKNVFEKFYRGEKGDVHTVKGFGLGLSYVKSIVKAHQGTLSLTSHLGEGSIFTIYLPQLGTK